MTSAGVSYSFHDLLTSPAPSGDVTPTPPMWTESDLYNRFTPTKIQLDRIVPPIWYVIGITGNILSFVVWIQRKMRHSSGCYLAALAIADLIFLLTNIIYVLHTTWDTKILDYPVACESFMYFYMMSQYLSPILVLAFTVERFISICHPFLRDRCCSGPSNTKIAVRIIMGIFVFALALSGMQGYLWSYSEKTGLCDLREGAEALWSVWSWLTEMLIFVTVPFATLIINILVVREAIKISNTNQIHMRQSNGYKYSTTIMLLSVSFYYIVTALPVAVTYSLYTEFEQGDTSMTSEEIRNDPTWKRHFDYMTFRAILHAVGISHYALNFYIYLCTGKLFRKQLVDLFKFVINGGWRRSTLDRSSVMTFKTSSFSTGRTSLKPDYVEQVDACTTPEQEQMM